MRVAARLCRASPSSVRMGADGRTVVRVRGLLLGPGAHRNDIRSLDEDVEEARKKLEELVAKRDALLAEESVLLSA